VVIKIFNALWSYTQSVRSKDIWKSRSVNMAICAMALIVVFSLINIEDQRSSVHAGIDILSGKSGSATFVSTSNINFEQTPIEGFIEGSETLESGGALVNGWFKNGAVLKIGIEGSLIFEAPAVFIERSDLGNDKMGFQVYLADRVLKELLVSDNKICLLGLGVNQQWAQIQTLSGDRCLEFRE